MWPHFIWTKINHIIMVINVNKRNILCNTSKYNMHGWFWVYVKYKWPLRQLNVWYAMCMFTQDILIKGGLKVNFDILILKNYIYYLFSYMTLYTISDTEGIFVNNGHYNLTVYMGMVCSPVAQTISSLFPVSPVANSTIYIVSCARSIRMSRWHILGGKLEKHYCSNNISLASSLDNTIVGRDH